MSDVVLTHSGGTSSSRWSPETPFLDRFLSNEGPGSLATIPKSPTIESPFYVSYREAPETDEVDAVSSAIAEVLDELHDEEFDDALLELVDEAWELGGPRITLEARQSAAS